MRNHPTMVDTMMLGRVEDVLQRPEILDHLGMDPELEDQVELGVNDHVGRWNEEGHRKVERLQSKRPKFVLQKLTNHFHVHP